MNNRRTEAFESGTDAWTLLNKLFNLPNIHFFKVMAKHKPVSPYNFFIVCSNENSLSLKGLLGIFDDVKSIDFIKQDDVKIALFRGGKVLFSGTRNWYDKYILEDLILDYYAVALADLPQIS